MSDDMIILTKTFDLLAWLLPKSEQFPKVYRHTVTERLMKAALDFGGIVRRSEPGRHDSAETFAHG